MLPVEGVPETEFIRIAASLEQASEHPLGQAIVRSTAPRAAARPQLRFRGVSRGRGAAASCSCARYSSATRRCCVRGRRPGVAGAEAAHLREHGQTAVFVALDGVPIGLIALADPLKEEAWEVVKSLQDRACA